MPAAELRAKPASVSATTVSANRGSCGRSAARLLARRGRPRSTAKKRRNANHSTATTPAVGSAIRPAKRVNDSELAWKASRLVRFETGSSSDAEFARCEHAYTCGRGLVRSRAAVANTTGVNNTTVASRLKTAVTAVAAANTSANSRRGRSPAPAAIAPPIASNSPSRRHPSASTSSAARKPTVGPSSPIAARASPTPSAPAATSASAPPPATAASIGQRECTTAAANVAPRTSRASTSATDAGTTES